MKTFLNIVKIYHKMEMFENASKLELNIGEVNNSFLSLRSVKKNVYINNLRKSSCKISLSHEKFPNKMS